MLCFISTFQCLFISMFEFRLRLKWLIRRWVSFYIIQKGFSNFVEKRKSNAHVCGFGPKKVKERKYIISECSISKNFQCNHHGHRTLQLMGPGKSPYFQAKEFLPQLLCHEIYYRGVCLLLIQSIFIKSLHCRELSITRCLDFKGFA